jgi:hypothetical protein
MRASSVLRRRSHAAISWIKIEVRHSRRVAYIAGFGHDLEALVFLEDRDLS